MSKIGHNKPPRDIQWKSISINKFILEDLKRIRDHIQMKRDADNPKRKRVTIPMAIEIIASQYWLDYMLLDEVELIHETKKPKSVKLLIWVIKILEHLLLVKMVRILSC